MKIQSILLFFILSIPTLNIKAQEKYEKGYFIDTTGNKTVCFIKNKDWKNNPSKFQYKIDETSEPMSMDNNLISEFGVYGYPRYLCRIVKMDRSSNKIEELTQERNPKWFIERLFLKEIVKGNASLYYYEDESLIRFFYSISDTNIDQLIYKPYIQDNAINYNESFKQQLINNVNCNNTDNSKIINLRYTINSLTNYFQHYNVCMGGKFQNEETEFKRQKLNLKCLSGLNLSGFKLKDGYVEDKFYDFDKYLNLTGGLEFEFVLPFNKNKWSLLLQSIYSTYNAELQTNSKIYGINIQTIEFPMGFRYYIFLSDKAKIFINPLYTMSTAVNFDSHLLFYNVSKIPISPGPTLSLGAGYEFGRYSLELKYYTGKDMFINYFIIFTKYSRIGLNFGYKIYVI